MAVHGFACAVSVTFLVSFNASLAVETPKGTPQPCGHVSSRTKVGGLESHAWVSIYQLTKQPR